MAMPSFKDAVSCGMWGRAPEVIKSPGAGSGIQVLVNEYKIKSWVANGNKLCSISEC